MMYRVVIADDEKVERSGVRFLLKRLDEMFEISEFSNGQEAWEWLSKHPADILLTDVKMPFMDGMELIRRVYEKDPGIRIVVFSGFSEFEYARIAMKYHAENYILKPVNPAEFSQTMKRIVAEITAEREKERKFAEMERRLEQLEASPQEATGHEIAGGGGVQSAIHPEIETVRRYIQEHYGDELGIEKLAQLAYMAPAYLSTMFKKETGQNLSKFIREVRMERAKELLEESHRKIIDIGVAVGYPNVSYFCQSFREYYGISPQKYRSKGEES